MSAKDGAAGEGRKLKVRVPASSANLGPGFDTLGLALNLYLDVTIEESPGQPSVQVFGEGRDYLQENPDQNLMLKALRLFYERLHQPFPDLSIQMNSQIPVARGLGSSAAAVVAGLCAAVALNQQVVALDQVLETALEMEGHADNLVPALMGGLNCVMIYQGKVYHQPVALPDDLSIVVAVPDFTLSTEKARGVLPETVSLKDTVSNLQRACFLLAGLFNRNTLHMEKAMDDMIYQPLRKQLIPGFDRVMQGARQAGALGAALSGAGPSVLAFCRQEGEMVGRAMQNGFSSAGVKSRIYHLHPDNEGVQVHIER
ncbi:MAG: homoserine kinase [Syntrophomonadaceae bacterium]